MLTKRKHTVSQKKKKKHPHTVTPRDERSDIHSGSVRIYSNFGFSGLKILVPFEYF